MNSISYIWQKVLNFWNYLKKYKEEQREYSVVDDVNFTDIFANKLKNLSITDCKIQVTGTSQRAELLNSAVLRMRKRLGKITSFMLGYGGVVVIPYIANNKIFLNTVNQDNFVINSAAGDEISDCAILADTYKDEKANVTYRRWVRYVLQNGVLTITQIALKDVAIISLQDVAQWANIQEQVIIQGVEKMPFAFIACPKDNRRDEQIKGVPITFGAEKLIEEAKHILSEIEDEFGTKATRIFVDDILFRADKKLSKEYVRTVGSGLNKSSIEEYSPAIRDSSYYNRLMQTFALIEKTVGTSAGILTPPTPTNGATATEIKAGMFDTYSIISDVHMELEKGISEYIEACELLLNYYKIGQMGDYEVSTVWDYSMVESSQESFNQLAQAQAIGAVSKAEVRQFVFSNETLEEAQAKVDELKAAEPTIRETLGVA